MSYLLYIIQNHELSEDGNERAFIEINDESLPTQGHQIPQGINSYPIETVQNENSINIDEIQEEQESRERETEVEQGNIRETLFDNTGERTVEDERIALLIEPEQQTYKINCIDQENEGYKPLEELMQQKVEDKPFAFYQYEQIDLITQPIQMEEGEIILEDEPEPQLQKQEAEQLNQALDKQEQKSQQHIRYLEHHTQQLIDEQREFQLEQQRQKELQCEMEIQLQIQHQQNLAEKREQEQQRELLQQLNIVECAQPIEIEAYTQDQPLAIDEQIPTYEQSVIVANNFETQQPGVFVSDADPIERDAKDVIELKTIIESNDLKAMRAKIIELIPAQAENINSMCEEEIRDIYKTIELEIIEGGEMDKPPKEQQMNIKDYTEEVSDHMLPQQINEPIIIEEDIKAAPILNKSQEYPVLIQEDAEELQQPLQIRVATNQSEASAIQNLTYDIEGFRSLLKLDTNNLRSKLIEIFPNDKDSLICMDQTSLLKIIEEIILEIQREGSQPSKSTVPQEIPVYSEPIVIESQEVPKISIKQQQESEESEQIKLPQHSNGPTERQMREQLLKMFPDMGEDLSYIHGQGLRSFYEEAISKRSVPLEIPQTIVQKPQQIEVISKETKDPVNIAEPMFQFQQVNLTLPKPEMNPDNDGGSVAKSIEVNIQPVVQLQQSLQGMIKNLLEKYPELEGTLKDLNEEEIRSVYEEVVSLSQRKIPIKKTQTSTTQVYNQPQQTALPLSKNTKEPTYLDCDQIENEVQHQLNNHTHQQSTHHVRSSKSPDSAKNHKNGQQQKSHKAKNCKLNIKELRAKLIRKMPDLKDKISMLADKQIEKIFMETMSDGNFKRPDKKNEEKRPVIFLKDSSNKFHYPENIDIETKQLLKSKKRGAETELLQFSQPRKRSRTLLLLHTEEDEESNCTDFAKKVWKGNTGNVEKCQCDCCRRASSVPPVFRKIFDLLSDEYSKDSDSKDKNSNSRE